MRISYFVKVTFRPVLLRLNFVQRCLLVLWVIQSVLKTCVFLVNNAHLKARSVLNQIHFIVDQQILVYKIKLFVPY